MNPMLGCVVPHPQAAPSADQHEPIRRWLCDADWQRHVPRSALAVVAHADDEVIGFGTRLSRMTTTWLVHVTDGAPRDNRDAAAAGFSTGEAYADARRKELLRALATAGFPAERTIELEMADQQASHHMMALVRAVSDLIARLEPEVVITHPYEGGHPDHDATALAVHTARQLLAREHGQSPALVEMTSYHAGSQGIATGGFLSLPDLPVWTVALALQEQALKRRLYDCFVSQRAMLRYFSATVERFRPAPVYDFTLPPHRGPLFYEQFDWGITGPVWRRRAAECLFGFRLRELL
jgi:LmbE family N-acetylglucosaminyl deacetylase